MNDPRMAELEAMIEEGERRLAEFEKKLINQEVDMDTPRAMHILGLMCQDLNFLYGEWRLRKQDTPSLAVH